MQSFLGYWVIRVLINIFHENIIDCGFFLEDKFRRIILPHWLLPVIQPSISAVPYAPREHHHHITRKYVAINFLFLWGRPGGSLELGLIIYLSRGPEFAEPSDLKSFPFCPAVWMFKLAFLYYEGTRLSAIRWWVNLSQVFKLSNLSSKTWALEVYSLF